MYLLPVFVSLQIIELNFIEYQMINDINQNNETVKGNERIVDILHRDFPQCFTADGKFDLEIFNSLVKEVTPTTHEGYSLQFLGKNYASLVAATETTTVVKPDEEHNSKPENINSRNIYISGDNLDALKHLRNSYSETVKCIYIDPPYNTGTDGFVYNDNFNYTTEQLQNCLGISEEAANRILEMTTKGSASHSAWLAFMFPRLILARDLLTKDGVIFISIDDNEQANLRLLCDSIFGEENRLGVIANINNPKGRSDDKYIATAHEYILIYSKDQELADWFGFEPTKEIIRRYNKIDELGKKYREIDLRKTGENDLREDRPNLFYYFYYNTNTHEFKASRSNQIQQGFIQIAPLREDGKEGNWRWEIATATERINELIPKYMPVRKIWGVMQKDMLDGRQLVKPTSAWTFKDINSERGTEDFVGLGFDKRIFPKPKPVATILRTLSLVARDKDCIILDFFSGSATTAHAVMKFNAIDNGKRKFILVQIPEETQETSVARKSGYLNICEIGQERIKRAAIKIKESNPLFTGDLGFKHYTLVEPSDQTFNRLEEFNPNAVFDENIFEEFGLETILCTWALRDGYGLNAEIQPVELNGYTAYMCGRHLYFITPNLLNVRGVDPIVALIDRYNNDMQFKPENIVLFGYSFTYTETEALKKNLSPLRDGIKNLKVNLDIRY